MGCSAAASSWRSMVEPRTERFRSSTTANAIGLLLHCALRFRRFRKNRRKLGYSGPVDDFAVRIESRAVAGAVPGLLRTVPADDAVQMGADRRPLVDATVVVAVHRDLASTATDDRALAGLDRIDGRRFAASEVVLVLLGDVGVFLDVLRSRAQSNACRIIQLCPLVLAALNELVENDSGDGTVGHAVAGVSGSDPDVLIAARVLADVSHVVDGLHYLAGPAVVDALNHRKALACPLLEVREARLGVLGLTRLVIFAADDEDVVVQLSSRAVL